MRYRGKGGRFSYFFNPGRRDISKRINHGIGVILLGVAHGGPAFVEGNQQRASLRQFVLEDIEVGFDAFQPAVVDLGGLVVHGHEVLVEFSDVFCFAFVASLED